MRRERNNTVDIKLLKTGKVMYHFDNEVGFALVEMGLAERYVRPPKPEPVPQWHLWTNPYGEIKGLAIELGSELLIVPGSPKGMADRAQRLLAGRKAPLPSDELIEQYARFANSSAFVPVPKYDGSGR